MAINVDCCMQEIDQMVRDMNEFAQRLNSTRECFIRGLRLCDEATGSELSSIRPQAPDPCPPDPCLRPPSSGRGGRSRYRPPGRVRPESGPMCHCYDRTPGPNDRVNCWAENVGNDLAQLVEEPRCTCFDPIETIPRPPGQAKVQCCWPKEQPKTAGIPVPKPKSAATAAGGGNANGNANSGSDEIWKLSDVGQVHGASNWTPASGGQSECPTSRGQNECTGNECPLPPGRNGRPTSRGQNECTGGVCPLPRGQNDRPTSRGQNECTRDTCPLPRGRSDRPTSRGRNDCSGNECPVFPGQNDCLLDYLKDTPGVLDRGFAMPSINESDDCDCERAPSSTPTPTPGRQNRQARTLSPRPPPNCDISPLGPDSPPPNLNRTQISPNNSRSDERSRSPSPVRQRGDPCRTRTADANSTMSSIPPCEVQNCEIVNCPYCRQIIKVCLFRSDVELENRLGTNMNSTGNTGSSDTTEFTVRPFYQFFVDARNPNRGNLDVTPVHISELPDSPQPRGDNQIVKCVYNVETEVTNPPLLLPRHKKTEILSNRLSGIARNASKLNNNSSLKNLDKVQSQAGRPFKFEKLRPPLSNPKDEEPKDCPPSTSKISISPESGSKSKVLKAVSYQSGETNSNGQGQGQGQSVQDMSNNSRERLKELQKLMASLTTLRI